MRFVTGSKHCPVRRQQSSPGPQCAALAQTGAGPPALPRLRFPQLRRCRRCPGQDLFRRFLRPGQCHRCRRWRPLRPFRRFHPWRCFPRFRLSAEYRRFLQRRNPRSHRARRRGSPFPPPPVLEPPRPPPASGLPTEASSKSRIGLGHPTATCNEYERERVKAYGAIRHATSNYNAWMTVIERC